MSGQGRARPTEKESVQSVVVLHFLKLPPTSLGLLFLDALVVVLIEYVGADVHPVTHDFLGGVFRQVVRELPRQISCGETFTGHLL